MSVYMKVDGIEGDVTTKGFEKTIAISGIQFSADRSVHTASGRTYERTTGLPKLGYVTLTKLSDQATPYLFIESCVGKPKDEIVISFCHTNSEQSEYQRITLYDALLSNYDSNTTASLDASESNTQTFETLQICYSKIEMLYISRDSDNRELTPIRTGYDLKKASKI